MYVTLIWYQKKNLKSKPFKNFNNSTNLRIILMADSYHRKLTTNKKKFIFITIIKEAPQHRSQENAPNSNQFMQARDKLKYKSPCEQMKLNRDEGKKSKV